VSKTAANRVSRLAMGVAAAGIATTVAAVDRKPTIKKELITVAERKC